MSTALQYAALYPLSGESLLAAAGTFWGRMAVDRELLKVVLEIMSWGEFERYLDVVRIRGRWSTVLSSDQAHRLRMNVIVSVDPISQGFRIELPERVQALAEIELPGGLRLEYLRDFSIEHGYLIVRGISLSTGQVAAVLHGVRVVTGEFSRFYSQVLQLADTSDNIAEILRVFLRASSNAMSEAAVRRLARTILETPEPSVAQTVDDVYTVADRPIIQGSMEQFIGPPGSQALVTVGDSLEAGQDLFTACRFWNTLDPVPSWLSSLKVRSRYFSPYVSSTLAFSNTNVSLTSTVVDGQVQCTFPISGDDQAVDEFFAAVRELEGELGVTLAEAIVGERSPGLSMMPAQVNPLELLHRLWLSRGALVTSTDREPTAQLLARLSLLRRLTPPWLTHIIHFTIDPDPVLDPLC